jgi:hypothetical protein
MANAMAGEHPAQLGADVVIDEDMADEEVEELVDMFEDRGDAVVDLGRAFVADAQKANALGKLSRYETSLLRSVERAQRQLEDLQAARSGKTE